jgi:predicted DNA-binding protein (UPF0251 family)
MSAAFVLPLLQARAEFVPFLRRLQAEHEAAVPQSPPENDGAQFRPAPRPQLAFYRKYTEALLRRYMRMSMELGRVPSMLGRGEMFRAKVSNYRMESFEDVVIFCHDIERCIQSLTAIQQSAIDLVAVKEYTIQEAAPMLGICREIAVRHYTRAIDRLTDMFIETEILNPARGRKCCQAPQPVQNAPS